MKRSFILFLLFTTIFEVNGQSNSFAKEPFNAKFVTSDIENFWIAFDSIEISKNNPFNKYLKNGTIGLQGFIPNRIMSADSLLNMVKRRKEDYEKMRNIESQIKEKEKETLPYFYALEYWYPYAVYPPVYFVFGRFNSGGTTSKEGLLIGAEMLTDLDGLPELIIHESIHFQQKWPEGGNTTLLQQSVIEGSADFIAELVTGKHGNFNANDYGNKNKESLCKEFVQIMNGEHMNDWLYGTSGKDNRPNDLGYWIGYEIVKAYFDKAENKKLAVNHILNIDNYSRFLKESGYLNEYIK